MLRTKINGKYVADKTKDYSNGAQPQAIANAQFVENQRLKATVLRMSDLLAGIEQCTKMADVRKLISTAKAKKANM